MLDIFLFGNKTSECTENLYSKRTIDIFHQNSFAEISKENSKLRTYKLIKDTIGRESYLDDIRNVHDRISLTKLRLSNHSLMIEKGRHLKMDKNLRFCPFCPSAVEDEIHFLLKCKGLEYQKKIFLKTLSDKNLIPNFQFWNDEEKFKILMTDSVILPHTANYITKIFHTREFLMSQHKNNN